MLDFDEAQRRLAAAGAHPQKTERCTLGESRGRVLATAVVATVDLPPADNSAMDGYAIRHADYAPGKKFFVQQRCFAGQLPEDLQPGNAIRLFTGSLMPAGADTVIMQEDCREIDNSVEILQTPALHSHVRKQGEDIRAGHVACAAGTLIRAAEMTMLASQGITGLTVYSQLKIGILTTGDELIDPGQPRREGQIYNSNGAMLTALCTGLGAQVIHVLHAMDTMASLQEAFDTLLDDCDLVLTAGGVSVGEKDLVKPAIEQLGGTLDLWRVCMKPGKPVALAYVHNKPIIGLPGNPVSASVVFTLLVTPLIRRMQGRSVTLPPVQYGKLATDRKFNETRVEFLRVRAEFGANGTTLLTPYAQQGSGIVSSLPWASGLARIPANTTVNKNDIVAYYDTLHWLT